MALGQDFDLKQMVLLNCSFGPQEIARINRCISSKYANFRIFHEAVNELESHEDEQSPAGMVRLGVCLYLLGKYRRSLTVLQHGDGGALAHFYMAKDQFALKNYDEAEKEYTLARTAGYSADDCALGIVEARRSAGKVQEALNLLNELSGSVQQTAEYLYQRGITAMVSGGTSDEVGNWFSRAVDTDPMHPGALFGLAMENDRRGNDDDALELYKRAAAQFPSHVGSLINLGIMYEDRGENDLAVQCYERILDAYPENERARLYLKDAQASSQTQEDVVPHNPTQQILRTRVADFELSARARNCLQQMGIQTLNDLCSYTEAELLSSKNFGETSLEEIKQMLASRGLQLGQTSAKTSIQDLPEVDSSIDIETLNKPIASMGFSVRARKCMSRSGITTLGDLIRKTADELLQYKNFGVTSLAEVRDKLETYGLHLHGE
ncbi:MAG: DNA-directed RNA polymerase subunit alpha C-terminal domain-containing protein [Thermoguttaceae bacterium]|nr:tetratricopeptide repeat protein [Thermoguttaceae bacterium]MDO4858267.1 DNA-directed RNA polymerase subunit alpha C-terminal domain-containing protein [Thermoguttaceae bacterium]